MFPDGSYDKIRAVFDQVMRHVTYESDPQKFGVKEFWEKVDKAWLTAPRHADCEEYAMCFMEGCIAEGFDARLVVVSDETGVGHCICEVADKEHQQSIFLDQRKPEPLPKPSFKGYHFFEVSPWNPTAGDTRPWGIVAETDQTVE